MGNLLLEQPYEIGPGYRARDFHWGKLGFGVVIVADEKDEQGSFDGGVGFADIGDATPVGIQCRPIEQNGVETHPLDNDETMAFFIVGTMRVALRRTRGEENQV